MSALRLFTHVPHMFQDALRIMRNFGPNGWNSTM
jgi:hypothetical protein